MKPINIKLVSQGVLGFIILQSAAVGVELHREYSLPQEIHFISRPKASQYCFRDIHYGAITNPLNHSREPLRDKTKELKVHLIGTTTGLSGDSVVMEFLV